MAYKRKTKNPVEEVAEVQEVPAEEVVQEEPKKELSLAEEFQQIIGGSGKKVFEKLCDLRARVAEKIAEDPANAELFLQINEEMKKNL